MFFRSTVVALAACVLSANAGVHPLPTPKDFCCAVTSAVTRFHEQSAATSFCSSYLSIHTKTITTGKTTTSSVSRPSVTTITKTVTPSSTITTTLTTTVASGTKAAYTTIPTSTTVTSTATTTAFTTTTTTQTSTSTVTTASTDFSTTTTITTVTSLTTTTSTALDTNFQCFTTNNPVPPKRGLSNNYPGLSFLNGFVPKQISSACGCLSLQTPSKTITTITTIIKTSSYPTTAVTTVTARPIAVTVTNTQSVVTPATTKASTAFSTGTASTTVTVTVSGTATATATVTTTVTVSSTTTSVATTSSTVTTTSTATATQSIGSDLTFRLATRAGPAQSGAELVAAAGLSSPPYNWFYWRTQHSGATTFQLDEQCQLLETFGGVYAQQKPSDPNPGLVYSGSGVPVTCEINIDTDAVVCSSPGGGSTTWLCDTSFGVNSYELWWMGEDNSPGSRCEEHSMYAAYTL